METPFSGCGNNNQKNPLKPPGTVSRVPSGVARWRRRLMHRLSSRGCQLLWEDWKEKREGAKAAGLPKSGSPAQLYWQHMPLSFYELYPFSPALPPWLQLAGRGLLGPGLWLSLRKILQNLKCGPKSRVSLHLTLLKVVQESEEEGPSSSWRMKGRDTSSLSSLLSKVRVWASTAPCPPLRALVFPSLLQPCSSQNSWLQRKRGPCCKEVGSTGPWDPWMVWRIPTDPLS